MFRRALVPIDGSALALKALELIPDVLDADGDVLLVSVIDTPEQWLQSLRSAGIDLDADVETAELSDLNEASIARAIEAQRRDAGKALATARQRLEELGYTRVSQTIVVGRPGEEIVRVAGDHGRDVIVLTSHGWSGLKRTMLGSVAEYIVRYNRGVPVMIAYPNESEA